jgi:hypothetical protein
VHGVSVGLHIQLRVEHATSWLNQEIFCFYNIKIVLDAVANLLKQIITLLVSFRPSIGLSTRMEHLVPYRKDFFQSWHLSKFSIKFPEKYSFIKPRRVYMDLNVETVYNYDNISVTYSCYLKHLTKNLEKMKENISRSVNKLGELWCWKSMSKIWYTLRV